MEARSYLNPALAGHPPRWDLPRLLRGWMPLESMSQVPSPKSKCRSICNTCRTILATAKSFNQIFVWAAPAPAPAREMWEFPPRPLSSPLHFLLVWHLFMERWCRSWDCHTTAPALSRRAFQGYSNSSQLFVVCVCL
jgi:hypothetical protein